MFQTFKNTLNVKVEPCPPQSQTKITIRFLYQLFDTFISIYKYSSQVDNLRHSHQLSGIVFKSICCISAI